MASTTSNMMALGTKAPAFTLLNVVDDANESLDELKGVKGTVIMFICNHCPFVKHINHELSNLAKVYKSKGIECIAINSNDVERQPEDSPENMKQNAIDQDFIFPYLYDQTQEVAKAYDAACTPDFFLFDKDLKLVYRGQLDDARPGNDQPINGKDLREALNALLNNSPINKDQKPSIGCGIKWKPNN